MDGPEVFRHAVARMGEAAGEACARAGATLGDVDLFVFHQANARILQALSERYELPPERVVNAIGELGNTSAASIPLALAKAARRRPPRRRRARAARRVRRRADVGRDAHRMGARCLTWPLPTLTTAAPPRRGSSVPTARSRS